MARKRKRAGSKRSPRRDVFQRARRATVAFGVIEEDEKGQKNPKIIGSGFATRDLPGMVVTAKHLVADKDALPLLFIPEPVVRDPDGTLHANLQGIPLGGVYLATHNTHDVAVLVLPGRTFSEKRSLPLDYEAAPRVGQAIATFGWPYGLKIQPAGGIPTSSALTGVVSAVYPHPSVEAAARSSYLAQLPVSPGHSGGPVFNPQSGKVFGVQSARAETIFHKDKPEPIKVPAGLAHVVPVAAIREVVERYREERRKAK